MASGKKASNNSSPRWWTPIFLLGVILVLWFLISIAFNKGLWILPDYFGCSEQLQNIFSPIGALFSGIAAWGAIYTIYKQSIISARQQFESVFFHLIDIHNENRRAMRYPLKLEMGDPKEYLIGEEAFERYYFLLSSVYDFAVDTAKDQSVQSKKLALSIQDEISRLYDQDLKPKALFNLAYDVYKNNIDTYYSNYVRHIYHVLRFITDNSSSVCCCKPYIRIFRAQLSKYEAVLLYYRAITSPDKCSSGNGKSKYQELIEESSFLHLMCDDQKALLFDDNVAGKMDESAFGCNS